MARIAPCLWFDGQAEEAATFYIDSFRAAGQPAVLGDIMRYGTPRPVGTVLSVTFSLAG